MTNTKNIYQVASRAELVRVRDRIRLDGEWFRVDAVIACVDDDGNDIVALRLRGRSARAVFALDAAVKLRRTTTRAIWDAEIPGGTTIMYGHALLPLSCRVARHGESQLDAVMGSISFAVPVRPVK